MNDWGPVLDAVNTGGAVAILVILLWAFITERIVPRGRMLEWKELALGSREIVKDSVKTAVSLAPESSVNSQLEYLKNEVAILRGLKSSPEE